MLPNSLTPASQAEIETNRLSTPDHITFTSSEAKFEQPIYDSLDEQLSALERSMTIDWTFLTKIEKAAKQLLVLVDEKFDLLKRIQGLYQLEDAKMNIKHLKSKEEASKLKYSLSGIQTSPLKKKILMEIDLLSQSLANEVQTSEQELMGLAIEQAGEDFINLGKMGRQFVIDKVLRHNSTSLDRIRKETKALEEQVNALKQIDHIVQFRTQLEKIPLSSFTQLHADEQQELIYHLMKENDWQGLLELEHKILKVTRKIKEEKATLLNSIGTNYSSTIYAKQLFEK